MTNTSDIAAQQGSKSARRWSLERSPGSYTRRYWDGIMRTTGYGPKFTVADTRTIDDGYIAVRELDHYGRELSYRSVGQADDEYDSILYARDGWVKDNGRLGVIGDPR